MDYERYDHTYCRILKDGEEIINRKRKLSAASYEKSTDDLDEQPVEVPAPVNEKENGARDPVIIVRAKKHRRPATSAVKPVRDKEPAIKVDDVANNVVIQSDITIDTAVEDLTTEASSEPKVNSKNSNKPTPSANHIKRKYIKKSPAEKQQVKEKKELKAKKEKKIKVEKKKKQTRKSKISPQESIEEPLEPITQITQSGRIRKLTVKARENPDKYFKAQSRRAKAKPKVPSEKETQESHTTIANPQTNIEELNDTKIETNLNAINADAESKSSDNRSKASSERKSKKVPPTKQTPIKKARSKANDKKSGKKVSKVCKKQSTSKQKLVVVTKAPPKRKAPPSKKSAQVKKQRTNRDNGVLPAKIDINNIVAGSRRNK